MNENQNDIAKSLITRHLTGEITSEESKELTKWRSESPENDRLYEEFRRVNELSKQKSTHDHLDINLDKEWDRFKASSGESETKVVEISQPSNSEFHWMRVAAAVTLLIASGVAINYFISKPEMVVIETADNVKTITLPDGSTVDLNKNSLLSYPENFGENNRNISFNGEALFSVTPGKDKPFIISVNETLVEVLGTTFNVMGFKDSQTVEVIVEEGTVGFSDLENAVELSAGERGVYTRSSGELTETINEDANFLSWKTRKIVFVESDLASVVATLNKIFGDQISIKTEVPDSCEVTVSFDDQTLEAILNVLKNTLNLTYNSIDGTIEIVNAECN